MNAQRDVHVTLAVKMRENQSAPPGNEKESGYNGDAFITLVDVTKNYHTSAGPYPALKGINSQFKKNLFTGIIGKSGAGKSTLVNMITGVDQMTSGEIWIDGTPIHLMDENQMALWRGRNMGVVYQSFQLLPKLTLLDNILLPMEFCGLYRPKESEEWAKHLLEEVELEDHIHKLPSAISGGQHQRAAIARALANDPPIIIADEPTGNLDTVTAEVVFDLFERLVANGKTVVIVSHDPALSERCSHILQLADGEIIQEENKNGKGMDGNI
jgi:putative ABC transport system ATP-binding protein